MTTPTQTRARSILSPILAAFPAATATNLATRDG